MPAYCSGATYLVFLKTLKALQDNGTISLSRKTWDALVPRLRPDGAGLLPDEKASGGVGTRTVLEQRGFSMNWGSDEISPISPQLDPVTF